MPRKGDGRAAGCWSGPAGPAVSRRCVAGLRVQTLRVVEGLNGAHDSRHELIGGARAGSGPSSGTSRHSSLARFGYTTEGSVRLGTFVIIESQRISNGGNRCYSIDPKRAVETGPDRARL
jgi:hypothetical protein